LRHVEPPELAERLAQVLGAVLRIVAALAVAEALSLRGRRSFGVGDRFLWNQMPNYRVE
jgi:hypothetical protein